VMVWMLISGLKEHSSLFANLQLGRSNWNGGYSNELNIVQICVGIRTKVLTKKSESLSFSNLVLAFRLVV
jgi:hypothetical protein